MITTATEIKYVENSFEDLKAIELDLERILVEEYAQGLPNDIDNPA
ncbi:MAG: hypothetical protein QNJ70_09550 [Xenococcaceae cyanobacterium MO_207.B15]|nr:hypothetical protein [Xenococcaceae cyanobacterium MO_207.B15]